MKAIAWSPTPGYSNSLDISWSQATQNLLKGTQHCSVSGQGAL